MKKNYLDETLAVDFDGKIDEIVFRYELDTHYPKYRKKKRAEAYLRTWSEKFKEETNATGKILCLSADECLDIHFRPFILDTEIFEYQYISLTPIMDEKKLRDISWEDYRQIWIVSLEGETAFGAWLYENQIPYHSLYDSFSLNGIELEDEFYICYSKKFSNCEKYHKFISDKDGTNVFLEWHYQYMRFLEAKDQNLKKYYLENLFFLAIEQRNFVWVEKYYQEIKCFEDHAETYEAAWNDLRELISDIAARLTARKQRDIVMCWMDSTDYGTEKEIPFLKKEMEEGIYFENAFTLFCNTYPTFRYLFSDVKENDISLFAHQHVLDGNASKVCDMLKKHNYDFKVISELFNAVNLKPEYCKGIPILCCAPASLLLWEACVCLLNSDYPCFVVVHELVQTHGPVFASAMSYGMFNQVSLRKKQMFIELNEQLQFYMSMLNENATRIYMSDHGFGEGSLYRQTHCMFAVKGKNCRSQRVKEIFSYKDFGRLLQQLLERKINISEVTCDCAQIFAFPLYNRTLIGNRIKRKEIKATELGARGCVTEDYVYLTMKDDRELLMDRNKIPSMEYLLPSSYDVYDQNLLSYFRGKVGNLVMDWQDEKWKYAKYYSKVYENWKQYKQSMRGRNPLEELNQYIVVSGFNKIGIRMGGWHSVVLYEWLNRENQDKIVCFIDNCVECDCARFGKKILPVTEINSADLDMVILSSYEYIEMLRNESMQYPNGIKVFDMFRFLEQKGYPNKGIHCDLIGMPDEGYDVGFPF